MGKLNLINIKNLTSQWKNFGIFGKIFTENPFIKAKKGSEEFFVNADEDCTVN